MAAIASRMPLSFASSSRRRLGLVAAIFLVSLVVLVLHTYSSGNFLRAIPIPKNLPLHVGGSSSPSTETLRNTELPPPVYRPTPTYTAPAVTDPFPGLATSTGTPEFKVPAANVPRPGLHTEYGLSYLPPLFIGFTRQWPILLQAVVSYITAGWPPESIFVVENTGVQGSNAAGKLSLQNPFYLNHTSLQRLGVNILETPALLSFSQMQNFFLATARQRSWPYYFYSHQDVLVFSFEDGPDTNKRPADRPWEFDDAQDEADVMRPPAAGQPGYRTLYENCIRELNRTMAKSETERMAFLWFQYDHLTLVRREALESIGGWDSLIPYYMSDCDMNARLVLDGWKMRHRRVGIINDISTTLVDLAALYRDPSVEPAFSDPNPAPPEEKKEEEEKKTSPESETEKTERRRAEPSATPPPPPPPPTPANLSDPVEYFRELVKVGIQMGEYKYGDSKRGRNTWQASQHGGEGDPYYYDPNGFAQSFDVLVEAGREVYRRKWGHRDCDIVEGTNLNLEDQWHVEKDWKD